MIENSAINYYAMLNRIRMTLECLVSNPLRKYLQFKMKKHYIKTWKNLSIILYYREIFQIFDIMLLVLQRRTRFQAVSIYTYIYVYIETALNLVLHRATAEAPTIFFSTFQMLQNYVYFTISDIHICTYII